MSREGGGQTIELVQGVLSSAKAPIQGKEAKKVPVKL